MPGTKQTFRLKKKRTKIFIGTHGDKTIDALLQGYKHRQISMMELFAEVFSSLKLLTIFATISIIDVRQGS